MIKDSEAAENCHRIDSRLSQLFQKRLQIFQGNFAENPVLIKCSTCIATMRHLMGLDHTRIMHNYA